MVLVTLDLFSGIGGFALAGKMVGGFEVTQFVEINPYCQSILAKNFPGVPIHGDIKTYSTSARRIDVVTGGFPCQDISVANTNGRGLEGDRSGLFYEVVRIIRECRPRYVVLENVNALLTARRGRDMGAVLWELSECGYDAEWQTVSAASMGAPHLRKRVFIVAYPNGQRWNDGRIYRERRYVHGNHHHGALRETDANSNGIGNVGWLFGGSGTESAERREKAIGALDSIEAPGSGKVIPNPNSSRRQQFNPTTVTAGQRLNSGRIVERGNPWGVEPGILRVDARLSLGVDEVIASESHDIVGLNSSDYYATEAEDRPGEALSVLQQYLDEESLWRQVGGSNGLPEKGLLQRDLHGISHADRESIKPLFEALSEGLLRDVWLQVISSPCSPSKQDQVRQFTREFTNSLRQLPSKSALGSREDVAKQVFALVSCLRQALIQVGVMQHASDKIQEAWQSATDSEKDWAWMAAIHGCWWAEFPSVGRVTANVPHRVDRIRGLGNAVVPQCAAVALQRVLELEAGRL